MRLIDGYDFQITDGNLQDVAAIRMNYQHYTRLMEGGFMVPFNVYKSLASHKMFRGLETKLTQYTNDTIL